MTPRRPLSGMDKRMTRYLFSSQEIPAHEQQSSVEDQLRLGKLVAKDKRESFSSGLQSASASVGKMRMSIIKKLTKLILLWLPEEEGNKRAFGGNMREYWRQITKDN
ncbi:hypothetical protein HanIR_Chr09g0391721 [Helianthus annuus]|nr:hypothetical protein HanIR_Chr09g0391721 [Helianthus annuus]